MTDTPAAPTFKGAKSFTVVQELNIPEELYDGNGRVILVREDHFLGGGQWEIKIHSLTEVGIGDEGTLAIVRIETHDMFLLPQIVKSWLNTHHTVVGKVRDTPYYVVANQ